MDRVDNHQHSLSLSDKKQQQSHSNKVQKSRRYQRPRKWLESLFSEISGGTSCILRNSALNVQKCKQTPHLFRKDSRPTLLHATLLRSYNLQAPPALPQRAQILFCPQMPLTVYTNYPSPLAIVHFAPVLRLSQTRSAQSLLSGTAWGKAVTPAEARQPSAWLLVLHSKFVLLFTLLLLTETGVTSQFCLDSSPWKKPPALSKTIHSEEVSADSSVRLQITQKARGEAVSLPSTSESPQTSPSSFALPIWQWF